tara:strand:+ start:365 stop:496 length:132 start_codon:yes stop_codon:yes gene_type:complete
MFDNFDEAFSRVTKKYKGGFGSINAAVDEKEEDLIHKKWLMRK